ncbi:hypothetical protein NDU88_003111 [Pleurodeles waltl]|uniref:Uncharacterized protein n=1 Tax=Pleurodeles waltl TaxID=8319 RepID=A0AAV7WQM1_PLEWA|nr:hypothetical protein NDU88_003111 [Pleurodeles waltl]
MKNRYPGGNFKTVFGQNTWTVARVKGTLVTVKRKDETVTRNISCFKLYHGERLESEGKEMAESHVRENEVVRRPSSHGEVWLPSCPPPASEEREGMDIASHREPDQGEETAITTGILKSRTRRPSRKEARTGYDEDVMTYVAALRGLAVTCDFRDLNDSLIRDQIVRSTNNKKVKEKLLSIDPSLEESIQIARSMEHTETWMKEIEAKGYMKESDKENTVEVNEFKAKEQEKTCQHNLRFQSIRVSQLLTDAGLGWLLVL